jgi:hypothetical protein
VPLGGLGARARKHFVQPVDKKLSNPFLLERRLVYLPELFLVDEIPIGVAAGARIDNH